MIVCWFSRQMNRSLPNSSLGLYHKDVLLICWTLLKTRQSAFIVIRS